METTAVFPGITVSEDQEREVAWKMAVGNHCPWRQDEKSGGWYCACAMHGLGKTYTTRGVYVPPPADHVDKYTRWRTPQ